MKLPYFDTPTQVIARDHRLYVIVNRDLTSMNDGKAQAHSGHAANLAVHKLNKIPKGRKLISEWQGKRGFGTQINLKAPWEAVCKLVATHMRSSFIGLVTDPTYPYTVDIELLPYMNKELMTQDPIIKGEKAVVFRRQHTAAFFFVPDYDEELRKELSVFELA